MKLVRPTIFAVLFTVTAGFSFADDNWPCWRGPHGNGVADGAVYPTTWDNQTNVAWKFKLPGRGASTPVIWDDSIFLTCGDQGEDSVICLDRQGNLQWHRKLGEEKKGKHSKASGSNSSAVTDGELVFAYFKSGTLVCLDFAGNLKWKNRDGPVGATHPQ